MFDNLGKALRLIREIRGKSAAQVARQAGVGKSQLSKYENGKELPKFESLKKVLDALEISAFEFFYTMHLIDIQAANISDLAQEARAQSLPPLILDRRVGAGLLSEKTDAAFQGLFDHVLNLYHQMFLEKLGTFPPKN
jgi:transcriptional regulator with XRE-family HTH domain